MAFEHWPWSVFGDAEKIARYNPLMRVPTLVLDGGEVAARKLRPSSMRWKTWPSRCADDAAGRRRPPQGAEGLRAGDRHCRQGRLDGLRDRHPQPRHAGLGRALPQPDRRRARPARSRAAPRIRPNGGSAPRIGYADITVACALRFLGDAHPGLFDLSEGWPHARRARRALRGHARLPGNPAALLRAPSPTHEQAPRHPIRRNRHRKAQGVRAAPSREEGRRAARSRAARSPAVRRHHRRRRHARRPGPARQPRPAPRQGRLPPARQLPARHVASSPTGSTTASSCTRSTSPRAPCWKPAASISCRCRNA